MRKDRVPCSRNNEMLRAAHTWIEHRHHQRRLVLGLGTIATAKDEVILPEHNVDRSREIQRWGND